MYLSLLKIVNKQLKNQQRSKYTLQLNIFNHHFCSYTFFCLSWCYFCKSAKQLNELWVVEIKKPKQLNHFVLAKHYSITLLQLNAASVHMTINSETENA